MNILEGLRIKIFADGANLDDILKLCKKAYIAGFTTNPTLMRKDGVVDYETFGRKLLAAIPELPVSLEVFADDFDQMEEQAHVIASWGRNVYVKIPITNTRRESSCPLIGRLSRAGIAINATALLTLQQVQDVADVLDPETPSIVSIFAGRIADTGIDPVPIMKEALDILRIKRKAELLWASPREVLNIVQADEIGCHIITVTNDVMNKLSLLGKDLDAYSLETVEMFYRDASIAGYNINTQESPRSVSLKKK
jgi:transaldolase